MNNLYTLKLICLFMLFSLYGEFAIGQTKTISGVVREDSLDAPIAGVTVKVKNGPQSAVTNMEGRFTMNISTEGGTLQFSHINYKFYERKIAKNELGNIDIHLHKLETDLDAVVVVGYGTQREREVTGSMVNVDIKEMEDLPVPSLSDALRGQVPGLQVDGGGGRPGEMASVRVRQQFNLSKDGGNTIPLIVIDDIVQVDPQTGLPSLERFNQLDLSEIESMTVLRDASTAIYGSRASQGAIVIKTKQGKPGVPKISYSAKFQTNDAISHGKVMNARQYGEYANKLGKALNWNNEYFYSDDELKQMESLDYDWLRNDWRAGSAMQHSLNVSGGSERATFFTGASYYTQAPNLGSQDFNRWTFRAGTDVNVASNLKLSATIAAVNTDIEKSFTKININDGSYGTGGEQNDYSMLLHMPKYIPWILNIDGEDQYISPSLGPHRVGRVSGNNSVSNWNYYDLLNNGSKTTSENFNYNGNFSLQYEVPWVKGLSFKGTYGILQSSGKTEQVMMPLLLSLAKNMNTAENHLYGSTTDWDAPAINKSNARVTYDNTTSKRQQMNFFASYANTFGKHDVSGMFSIEKTKSGWEDRYQIYDGPERGVYNGTSVSAGTLNPSNTITYKSESGTLSYLGRVNYNYDKKYLLQFVFRSDASTNFAPENYWGFFPGVSAGWIMSDESWFKESLPWVSFFKLRASLGRTGNANIKPWRWTQLYGAATDKGMGFGSNGGRYAVGITPQVTPNRNVRWDRTTQRNLGLDMSFLQSRLNVTWDGYYNSTSDMLTDMTGVLNVPISVGGAFAEENYAALDAWGTEVAVNWKSKINDVNYRIGMNFAIGNSKITRYYDQSFGYPESMSTRTAEGNYANHAVWGFKTWKNTSAGDGMLRTDADIDAYWDYLTQNAANSGIEGAQPQFFDVTDKSQLRKGMLVYEDIRGAIDEEGRTYAGPNGIIENSEQDHDIIKKSNVSYGVVTNLAADWKGLSFQAQISTSWGGANYLDYLKQGTSSSQSLWSQPIYLTDMFDPDTNPNGAYPNLAYYDQFGGRNSDFFLMPSFRMFVRSLSVGYTLPKKWVSRAKVDNVRIFLSGNNLWDFYNPYPNKFRNMYDAANVGYPTLRTWSLGINLGL